MARNYLSPHTKDVAVQLQDGRKEVRLRPMAARVSMRLEPALRPLVDTAAAAFRAWISAPADAEGRIGDDHAGRIGEIFADSVKASVSQVLELMTHEANQQLLALVVADSIAEHQRPVKQAEADELLDSLDLPTLLTLLAGIVDVNKEAATKALGPLFRGLAAARAASPEPAAA